MLFYAAGDLLASRVLVKLEGVEILRFTQDEGRFTRDDGRFTQDDGPPLVDLLVPLVTGALVLYLRPVERPFGRPEAAALEPARPAAAA